MKMRWLFLSATMLVIAGPVLAQTSASPSAPRPSVFQPRGTTPPAYTPRIGQPSDTGDLDQRLSVVEQKVSALADQDAQLVQQLGQLRAAQAERPEQRLAALESKVIALANADAQLGQQIVRLQTALAQGSGPEQRITALEQKSAAMADQNARLQQQLDALKTSQDQTASYQQGKINGQDVQLAKLADQLKAAQDKAGWLEIRLADLEGKKFGDKIADLSTRIADVKSNLAIHTAAVEPRLTAVEKQVVLNAEREKALDTFIAAHGGQITQMEADIRTLKARQTPEAQLEQAVAALEDKDAALADKDRELWDRISQTAVEQSAGLGDARNRLDLLELKGKTYATYQSQIYELGGRVDDLDRRFKSHTHRQASAGGSTSQPETH